jgi:hypothetical protein
MATAYATETDADVRRLEGEPYEFSPAQGEVIGALGDAMKWVAIPAFAAGVMAMTYLFMTVVWAVKTGAYKDWQVIATGLFLLLSVIFYLALARWTLTASVGFRAVAQTHGHDMGFLMISLDQLRKKYGLLSILVKAFLILMLISLVMSVVGLFKGDGWSRYTPPSAPASAPAK